MTNTKQISSNRHIHAGFALVALVAGAGFPAIASSEDGAFIRTADAAELQWGPCPEFMPADCGIAVLQGNPAEPNADVFFKLAPNTSVPAHRHTSAERMVLVSGELQVEYEGQDPQVLKAGTYAYGPPNLSHSATCRSDEDCVLFIAFEEPVDAVPTE
jgi:quercetin dioxygenase-like cupin family protein